MKSPEERQANEENRFSALAIGKTLAFILYTLPTSLIAFVAFLIYAANLPISQSREDLALIFFIGFEIILLYLVVYGILPGTDRPDIAPFSETTAAEAVTAASFIPYILINEPEVFPIFSFYFNGSIIVIVMVFFITKSILSKSIRIKVLGALVLPAIHIFIGNHV